MAFATPSEQPDPQIEHLQAARQPRILPSAGTAYRGASQQYQRAQVETATPTRLVVLLYDGAIRFCHLAQDGMRRRDLEAQNSNLIRAQRIVGELLSSLNVEAGGEVATNLRRIYTHVLEELVKANLYDEPEKLETAISLLSEMRSSWVQIDRSVSCEPLVSDGAVKPAQISPPVLRQASISPALPGATAVPKSARLMASNAEAKRLAGESRVGDRLA